MKTNQLMQVRIDSFVLPIEHKSMMGNLTELWQYGNSLRTAKGLSNMRLDNYLNSPEVCELVVAIEEKIKSLESRCLEYNTLQEENKHVESTHYDAPKIVHNKNTGSAYIEGNVTVLKTKKGRNGGTWAHLYLLLDAAARLDANFKVNIYDTFVKGKLLEWRDESGDNFIALNAAIDAYLPERMGRDNTGIFIQVAKLLKEKIKPDDDAWNKASFIQLKQRADIEETLVKYLSMGFIRNYEHLKEVISKS